MTDSKPENYDRILALRGERRAALATFVRELGFEPENLRSVTVIDGSIRLTTFIPDENGEHLKAPNGRGKLLQEVNLLTTNTDLEQDLFMNKLMNGEPVN